jgi:hypothetical protein
MGWDWTLIAFICAWRSISGQLTYEAIGASSFEAPLITMTLSRLCSASTFCFDTIYVTTYRTMHHSRAVKTFSVPGILRCGGTRMFAFA